MSLCDVLLFCDCRYGRKCFIPFFCFLHSATFHASFDHWTLKLPLRLGHPGLLAATLSTAFGYFNVNCNLFDEHRQPLRSDKAFNCFEMFIRNIKLDVNLNVTLHYMHFIVCNMSLCSPFLSALCWARCAINGELCLMSECFDLSSFAPSPPVKSWPDWLTRTPRLTSSVRRPHRYDSARLFWPDIVLRHNTLSALSTDVSPYPHHPTDLSSTMDNVAYARSLYPTGLSGLRARQWLTWPRPSDPLRCHQWPQPWYKCHNPQPAAGQCGRPIVPAGALLRPWRPDHLPPWQVPNVTGERSWDRATYACPPSPSDPRLLPVTAQHVTAANADPGE